MNYKVTINGRTYEVAVDNGKAMLLAEYDAATAPVAAAPAAVAAPAAAAAPVVTGGADTVSAPMPGTILKINVANGDAVKEGAVLVVLEAMKMENEILAPRDAVISQVVATRGSTVDTGAPLVILA